MPHQIIDHYERHALAFDRDRSRHFPERAWIERLVLPLPRAGAILDLGCGGGEPVARYLIDRGFAVTGVDSSATMIDLARTRFPRQRWIQGDMRTFVTVERFEAVLAWSSLFHLEPEEQTAMITRMAEWLKPGGRLMFNSGPARGIAMGEYRGEPVYHASLAPAEYRALMRAASLIEMAHVAEDRNCGGATVWLARKP